MGGSKGQSVLYFPLSSKGAVCIKKIAMYKYSYESYVIVLLSEQTPGAVTDCIFTKYSCYYAYILHVKLETCIGTCN